MISLRELLIFYNLLLLLKRTDAMIQVVQTTNVEDELCHLRDGLSSIIVDVPESLGEDISQPITPSELPIIGTDTEITLKLIYPDENSHHQQHYFGLDGKRLKLLQPLDRDAGDISSVVFQVMCSIVATNVNRTLPIIVRVSDINDNPPVFQNEPYEVSISEASPVGTTVYRSIRTTDIDSGVNSLVEYFLVPDEDGSYFNIKLPHQGVVSLARSLDYETKRVHYLTVRAVDRAFDEEERKESFTTLTVRVLDSDDQGPVFVQAGCPNQKCTEAKYNATVTRHVLHGIIDIHPSRLQAVDQDSLNSTIEYSFLSGTPESYLDYFHIDPSSGIVRQTSPIESQETMQFVIVIKATELTPAGRSVAATLSIQVLNPDSHPPQLAASSVTGYVEELSPIGTYVLDVETNEPIRFSVSDQDIKWNDPEPSYEHQLTTSAFKVDSNGYLVVAVENLDRDPPYPPEIQFQVVTREIGYKVAGVSIPLVMNVKILDVNDHAPVIQRLDPISIAGGEGRREIVQVVATDADEGHNAQITYTIEHVSNNGQGLFRIDGVSGLLETTGENLQPGQHYTLTVQATDGPGKSTQTQIEITILNGPNLKPPSFAQAAYDVAVSEGSSIGAEVITLKAKDPEGQPIKYRIISGNELGHFDIGESTGRLIVNGGLDREDLSRYSLQIQATDAGNLTSTVHVNIRVLDINDRNPTFINTPYIFKVKEGQSGQVVGSVSAVDEDEHDLIKYETSPNPYIAIDSSSGQLTIIQGLDYEKEKEHHIIVTARDGSADSRIATATVTLQVEDVEDESPVFKQFTYEVNMAENLAKSKVVTVEAYDPDTVQKITYYIASGSHDLFTIDSKTGEIFTKGAGLDFEVADKHILIVGVEENLSGNVGSTTTVIVHVLDVNDIPPVFTLLPLPLRIEDNKPIGSVIGRLEAFDGDGSPPGNKVRYDVFGRGKAVYFFSVDHVTGEISVKDDLRKEMNSEYELDIRAYDLGLVSLSSMATVHIHVDHVVTLPPDQGVGFADTEYTVEISEAAKAQTTIKLLTIINKPKEMIPIECEIANGSPLFTVRVTKDKDCLVSLSSPKLDFEKAKEYIIQVNLVTLAGVVSKTRANTKIHVKVLDENDNEPFFLFPEAQKVGRGKKLYAAVGEDAQISSFVTQIKAQDLDSSKYGQITYSIDPSDSQLTSQYFDIHPHSGIVTTKRELSNVLPLLPFRLQILATDNGPKSHTSQVELIINIISQPHRMILAFDGDRPEEVKLKESEIIEIIQEVSSLIVGVEKITTRLGDDEAYAGTDVWFYCVDPMNDYVLERGSSRVEGTLLTNIASKTISHLIRTKLNLRARQISAPAPAPTAPSIISSLKADSSEWAAFPAALIALSCLIFIASIGGICLLCYKWSAYTSYKSQMAVERSTLPKYRHVRTLQPSPSFKEYETQILQMNVNNGCDEPNLHYDDGSPNLGQSSSFRTFRGHQQPSSLEQGMSNPIYERSDDDHSDDIDRIGYLPSNYFQ